MIGRRRAQRREQELTTMSAAGLSFAFAGPGGAVLEAPAPLWLLPAQSTAPVEESCDDGMDQEMDVLEEAASAEAPAEDVDGRPAPVFDDQAARILRLRGRF